jgi:glycosyltransferase involved in cell wall biosynthesis
MSALSLIDNVDVLYAGNWPNAVPQNNVQLLGVLEHDALIKYMCDVHYFLHPSLYDVCPNSLIEALALGLPALYHPGPTSSSELVEDNGIAIDESDLENVIIEARERYNDIVQASQSSRKKHGIKRCAEQYANVFKASLRKV